MLDPRFEQVLEFIDELDGDGKPTRRAMLGLKIQAYGQEVANLKTELLTLEEEANELLSTVEALEVSLEEQSRLRIGLVAKAQDASVSAAMSSTGSSRLRRVAGETRARIAEFENDLEQETARMAETKISLEAKQRAIKDQRGDIVRRLNTMSSLAERAGLEFGVELHAQPSMPQQPQQRSQQMGAPRVVRRRPRRVRIRRRRAS